MLFHVDVDGINNNNNNNNNNLRNKKKPICLMLSLHLVESI